MHKKALKIFLLTTLVFLLIGQSTITANEVNENQTTENFNQQPIKETHHELSTNTNNNQENLKTNINKKYTTKTKENNKLIDTKLILKFITDPQDEFSTDNYLITHKNNEYTLDITLTEEENNTPIPGQIQLYLQEDTQPIQITLNQSGHTQQTYTTQQIGINQIYAEYIGQEKYNNTTSDIITLDTEPYLPTLTINPIKNPCYNSTITIQGTLYYNENITINNANIIISFNNNQITTVQTNNQGKYQYNFNLENIPIQDKAIITVEYYSDQEEIADAEYNQTEFDIEKIRNNITINPINNQSITKTLNITGTITDENNKNYNGKIKATITNIDTNKETYNNNSVTVKNGQYNLTTILNNAGTYEIKIITPNDEYYMETIKTQQFKVEKETLTLKIEDYYESIVQENISITGKLTDENQQPINNVTIQISTDDTILGTVTTENDGTFNFTNYIFQEIMDDEYKTIYFNTIENNNYYPLFNESTIYISHRNAIVSLTTEDQTKINSTIHINGQVKDAYDETKIPGGTITIYIEDEEIKNNIPVINGTYNTTIDIGQQYLGKDYLQLVVFFEPSNPNIYNTLSNNFKDIKHELLESILTINSNDTTVDESTNIIINLEDENKQKLDKTITITITINDEIILQQTTQTVNGNKNITFTPNTSGVYHIIVQYDGEQNIYSPITEEKQIIVRKTDTKITTEDITQITYVNDTLKLKGQLSTHNNTPIENTEIQIIINTTNENILDKVNTNQEGFFEYSYTPKQAKQINITVISEETYKYNNNYTKIIVNPVKRNTTTKIENINNTIKYNTTIPIKVQVTDQENNTQVNGSITIKVNEKIINEATLTDGEYTFTYQVKEVGNNNKITVHFNQNDAYNESEQTITFNTEALNTKITINPLNTTQINKTITIDGIITDENNNPINGNLTIKINNKTIIEQKPTNNSTFTVHYTTEHIGLNNLNITLQQDELHYHSTNITETFNVTKADLQVINIQKQVNNKDNTITITGKLVNNNNISTENLEVNIIINNNTYSNTTNKDGLFTITTDKLQANEYKILLEVPETEYLNKLEENLGKLTIQKYTPKITVNNITNATYSKKLPVSGNISDNYQRPLINQEVIIIVGQEEYHTTTNNKGEYSILINNVQTGTNNMTIIVPETNNTYKATTQTTFNAEKDTAKIKLTQPNNITPGDTLTIKGQLLNSENNNLTNKNIIITINDKKYHTTTNNNGIFQVELNNTLSGNYTINVEFEDSNHYKTSINTTVSIKKLEVKLVVDNIVSRVGENITFHARLTDQYGNKVTGGNMVFKLNGRSLRADGRFDTNTPKVLKLNVKDGLVEYTMTADLYLRYGKNISASYSGSYKYESTKSNTANVSIQLRYANINVTTSTKTVKHHENITFTAKIADVTPKSNINLLNQNASVIFKINGVTIKDASNNIIKQKVINGTAQLNYNVSSMAGIGKNNKIRDYIVTAVYENSNYYPINNKNETTFNVERSIVNIGIQEVKVSGNILKVKANLTDYQGYLIEGKNKICVKINGVTYKENNKTKYYTIENGNINLENINVSDMKVKSLEIVTGERLAYLSARQTTSNISY